MTRKQLQDESRRIKQLREQGWSEYDIKSWLIGWRKVGGTR